MFWDELLPDTALEGKIADFTNNEIKKFINHTTMEPILEQIEMESEDEFSKQSNQQWRM